MRGQKMQHGDVVAAARRRRWGQTGGGEVEAMQGVHARESTDKFRALDFLQSLFSIIGLIAEWKSHFRSAGLALSGALQATLQLAAALLQQIQQGKENWRLKLCKGHYGIVFLSLQVLYSTSLFGFLACLLMWPDYSLKWGRQTWMEQVLCILMSIL